MTGLRGERAAEVIVRHTDGRETRGSGYLVRAGVVLTAAHVVRLATRVTVRFEADRPAQWSAPARVLWSDARADAALLALDAADPGGEGDADGADGAGGARRSARRVRAARFAAVRERDAGLRSSALGFPFFKRRDDADGLTSYRDSCHARGEIAPLADRREGTLELRVQEPERDPDPDRSPWEGMSGSAVWAHGRIVGVVSLHRREEGLGTLTVSRADRWAAAADEAGREALRAVGVTAALPPAAPRWREPRLLLWSGTGAVLLALTAWFATARLTAQPPLHFRVTGSCDKPGTRLLNASSGFTPGGRYTNEIRSPDGKLFPLGTRQSNIVTDSGSLTWQWTCARTDKPGTYQARVTDETTHRQTGWVPFTVAPYAPYACAFREENGLWYAGLSGTTTLPLPPPTGGTSMDDVAEAQCLLQRLGFDLGQGNVDGWYGERTRQAVVALQQQAGATADGLIGPATWRLLRTRSPQGVG
ncbi:peptidoglycan-binding domain-containing protein [Kitasatospora sp. NPDC002551]|uniref:peptidoglycan-binding domain-containing protein n=1 Tax=Kitasatospora sp. NPDC002551 TaxID=3154539 RepID=UPI003320EB8E